MGNFNDVEIKISDGGNDQYSVELSVDFASSAVRHAKKDVKLKKTVFDVLKRQSVEVNFNQYGQALTQIILIDSGFADWVKMVIADSQRQRRQLRFRLYIQDDAKELHELHWETLHDPDVQTETWLLANESVLFSRDLGSSQLDEEFPLRTREQLRALIVVANPTDIGNGKTYPYLAVIDVARESERIRQAMQELRPPEVFKSLAEGGNGAFVTLSGLIDKLNNEPGYDILYLVCHGKIVNSEPRIWLQADNGLSALTAAGGNDGLVTRIKNLPAARKPRLIVLASCESGGGELDTDGALAAFGPRLAREADIPAVIAMGGSISLKTIEKLMPRFFQQLARHGQIDQALAAARGEVASELDAWMPILYMRLKNGSIWSPGWAKLDSLQEFGGPAGLRDLIEAGTCVPILGSGILDFFTGPRGSFSKRWADDNHVPSEITPTNLPQVAQYISVTQADPQQVNRDFVKFVRKIINEEYKTVLPDMDPGTDIDHLIQQVAELRRKHDVSQDVIYQLANLPLPIYITTNPDRLLALYLKELGKLPREAVFPWDPLLISESEDDLELRELLVLDPKFIPTVTEPLIYYLFGRVDYPNTLALTEDDFFDYLLRIRSSSGEYELPIQIKKIVNWRPLLFLGFSHDDWVFRVMLRSLLAPREDKPRGERLLAAAVVGADTNSDDFERMQTYLEKYFESNKIRIYWGNTIDFVRELVQAIKVRDP